MTNPRSINAVPELLLIVIGVLAAILLSGCIGQPEPKMGFASSSFSGGQFVPLYDNVVYLEQGEGTAVWWKNGDVKKRSANFTDIIQSAMNGSVLITGGNYSGVGRLFIPDNTTVECQANTWISAKSSMNDRWIQNTTGPRKNIEIRNCNFDGNKDGQSGKIAFLNGQGDSGSLHFSNVSGLKIHDNLIINGYGAGIQMDYDDNFSVHDNTIIHSADDGIAINIRSNNGTVVNNVVSWSGVDGYARGSPHGIECEDGCNNTIIMNNIIHDINNTGIAVDVHAGEAPSNNNTIIGNLIYNTTIGIDLAGTAGANITNTLVEGNNIRVGKATATSYGIDLSLAADDMITGNYIEQYGNGIQITQSSKFSVTNNKIRNSDGFGIQQLATVERCDISNNHISNSGQGGVNKDGIAINGFNCTIVGNTIKNDIGFSTQVQGISLYNGAKNNTVANNFFYDNPTSIRDLSVTKNVIANNYGAPGYNWGNAPNLTQILSNVPQNANLGDFYFNTTSGLLCVYNGTFWINTNGTGASTGTSRVGCSLSTPG